MLATPSFKSFLIKFLYNRAPQGDDLDGAEQAEDFEQDDDYAADYYGSGDEGGGGGMGDDNDDDVGEGSY